MKYEETQKIINNIVENEFDHVQNENLKYMDELGRYKEIDKEISKLQDQMLKALPEEYRYSVNYLDCKMWKKVAIEERHYFKKGVAAGTSNLYFLRDLTEGIIFY